MLVKQSCRCFVQLASAVACTAGSAGLQHALRKGSTLINWRSTCVARALGRLGQGHAAGLRLLNRVNLLDNDCLIHLRPGWACALPSILWPASTLVPLSPYDLTPSQPRRGCPRPAENMDTCSGPVGNDTTGCAQVVESNWLAWALTLVLHLCTTKKSARSKTLILQQILPA
jgi:hypothetical protein